MKLTVLAFVVAIVASVLLAQNYTECLNLDFYQRDYELKFERADVASFNKRYLTHFNITTFKFNRTCAVFNLTYAYKKTDIILTKVTVVIQGYKFASNEFRHFPIRFQINMCDLYNKNIGGMGSPKCRNFRGCPTELGKEYYMCNFTPDQSKFPPLMPNGRYMMELQAGYNSIDLWNIHVIGEISRPIV